MREIVVYGCGGGEGRSGGVVAGGVQVGLVGGCGVPGAGVVVRHQVEEVEEGGEGGEGQFCVVLGTCGG